MATVLSSAAAEPGTWAVTVHTTKFIKPFGLPRFIIRKYSLFSWGGAQYASVWFLFGFLYTKYND